MTSSARRRPPPPRGGFSWRGVRITLLLLVLGVVALDAWLSRLRTTDWDLPLRVTLYPLVGDDRDATRRYVAGLTPEHFAPLAAFLRSEGRRHGLPIAEPMTLRLGPERHELPPPPPRGSLETLWWSLRVRRWANRMESGMPGPSSQVRLFVIYYDPATQERVAHSLGLQKGLIGVVHAFASRAMTPTNNVVIAHELLHTLGATDKYDLASGRPRYPDGYADPAAGPDSVQDLAELMGGRIPQGAAAPQMPVSLDSCLVGPATAREIGWIRQ